ncbi:MAG: hypothetical protein JWL99_4991 [Streptomyces oryziradicis]|jgi:hypothetical protein|nr:hypothetical protein [Actinacidiphila oryziradicis]
MGCAMRLPLNDRSPTVVGPAVLGLHAPCAPLTDDQPSQREISAVPAGPRSGPPRSANIKNCAYPLAPTESTAAAATAEIGRNST